MTRSFRLSLYFVLGLFLGGYSVFSHAFKVPVTPGAGIAGSAGVGYKTDGYQAFSNGKTMGTLQGSVSGQAFSFAAQYPLATSAAGYLLTFVKASPTAFAVGAVATWLANYGLSFNAQGEMVKNLEASTVGFERWSSVGADASTAIGACNNALVAIGWVQYGYSTTAISPAGHCLFSNATWTDRDTGVTVTGVHACSQNGTYYPMEIPLVCPAETRPANEEDLAAPKAAPLPDDAATEATNKGAKLPLSKPEIETAPKTITVGDPVTDPKTGVRTRDSIKITPQPSTPETVEATPYKQPVNEDGTPETDPTTGDEKAPEEEPDHCKQNPDTIGCSKWGEPEDANLETDTKNATINPDSGWGAATASCPADLNHTLKTGQTVGFKWKPLCDGATMFRPVVIGMAWLTATLIFMGISRKGQA